MTRMLFCVALATATAFGQGNAAFEAAVIKPAAPLDNAKVMAAMQSGGQMPIGPHVGVNRADYLYMTLKSLIVYAYQVKPYQVTGPVWLEQQRFDIIAKYPEGATKDDAPKMLQSLLEERFQLKVHKSIEERPVLGLVIGRGGPKLQASADKPAPIDDNAPLRPGERKVDGPGGHPMLVRTDVVHGAITVNMGEQGRMSYKVDAKATPPVIHIDLSMVTMTGFASMMTQMLAQTAGSAGRQIVDMTKIEGNYEASFDLSLDDMLAMVRNAGVEIPGSTLRLPAGGEAGSVPIAAEPSAGGLSLADAVRSMGLRLESRRAPVELLVVDHAEKRPTEN